MREIDPFDYWESHASAIEGLGGSERSPDPRYCFHTRYHEVREGRAGFVLKLNGVRAKFGEIAIRVHAWKPDGDGNISLVSGARLLLQSENDAQLELSVRFASRQGVLYSLYGYLSEDSDVSAQGLQVLIDEPEDNGDVYPEPPQSILAMNRQPSEARPANALTHQGRLVADAPVSQSCTYSQVAALGLDGLDADSAIARWSERICLNALGSYGVFHSGLEGLVVGTGASDDGDYAQSLDRFATVVRRPLGPPPSRKSDEFFDFMLITNAIGRGDNALSRWEEAEDWLTRLKIGGLGVLALRYRPDSCLISSKSASDGPTLSRNEIGQWTLRLIGNGYSVAPLAFAPSADLLVDHQELAGFVLIIQRL